MPYSAAKITLRFLFVSSFCASFQPFQPLAATANVISLPAVCNVTYSPPLNFSSMHIPGFSSSAVENMNLLFSFVLVLFTKNGRISDEKRVGRFGENVGYLWVL